MVEGMGGCVRVRVAGVGVVGWEGFMHPIYKLAAHNLLFLIMVRFVVK